MKTIIATILAVQLAFNTVSDVVKQEVFGVPKTITKHVTKG